MDCPQCNSKNTAPWGALRRRCLSCGRTYSTGEYTKPSHIERRSVTCPSCGTSGRHRIVDTKGGRNRMCCSSCNTRFWRVDDYQTEDGSHDVYVVTAAVNDAPAHRPFLAAMRRYCEDRGGRMIVIPLRYKNPTRQGEGQEVSWDKKLTPYIYDKRLKVCAGLQIMADIKTQPTAVAPLSGMDTITGTDCGIFGHTKVALEPVPTRGHELPKLLLTTGAVTKPVYSDTKAGKKGEFHHVLGAVVVERDGELFHLRHIHAASDGSFIDLDKKWTADGPTQAPPALALIMGDLHAERAEPSVLKATSEIQAALKPRRLVIHDALDFGSASHHNGYWERFRRRVAGKDKVIDELRLTCKVIDRLFRKGQQTVIISSNHNEHLSRWLADHRNGDDVQNAGIYHSAKSAVLAHIEKTFQVPNIFWLVARDMLKHPATFLGERDSLSVSGIELGYHGDNGPNGARGSAKAFDRIGVKTVIGHSHSPRIVGGCYQTGTSSQLDMGYNVGPSSWIHSHVVVYASGKRSHIHVIGGKWRK